MIFYFSFINSIHLLLLFYSQLKHINVAQQFVNKHFPAQNESIMKTQSTTHKTIFINIELMVFE